MSEEKQSSADKTTGTRVAPVEEKKSPKAPVQKRKRWVSFRALARRWMVAPVRWVWQRIVWRLVKVALCVAAVLAVMLFGGIIFIEPLLTCLINNSVDYLDLDAKVASVEVHILTQTLAIHQLTLMNPPGFIQKEALTADRVEFRLNLPHFDKPIRRVYVQNPKIRLEGKFGKRILASSMRRSNLFVIAREVANVMGVDLVEMVVRKPEDSNETTLANIDLIEEEAAALKQFGRVRVDHLHIENGMKDVFEIGSMILQPDSFEICDASAKLCDVELSMRNLFFDVAAEKLACTKLVVKNPKGYPDADAFFAGKMSVQFGDVPGTQEPCIDKIIIDSPTVRLEDTAGSMLGALGIENNFIDISKKLSILTGADVNHLYSDDFEIEIVDKDVCVPKLELEGVEIRNMRVTCAYKDGFKIGTIRLKKEGVSMDDIRMNLAKIKARVRTVGVDYVKQLCTLNDIALRNPTGFPEENAFLMKQLTMTTAMRETNIRGNRVLEIDTVRFSDFFVRLDSRSGDLMDLVSADNNLLSLLEDVNDAASFIPTYKESVQQKVNETLEERPRRYIIRSLVLEGGEIRLGPRGDAIKLPMEPIVLTNLGVKEGGLMSDEVVSLLIREIALRAMNAAEEQLPPGWFLLQPVIKAFKLIVRMVM